MAAKLMDGGHLRTLSVSLTAMAAKLAAADSRRPCK
jgi:hypothetical protein